jgi:hypothetical protein
MLTSQQLEVPGFGVAAWCIIAFEADALAQSIAQRQIFGNRPSEYASKHWFGA